MYYLEKYILVNTEIHYLTPEEKNTNIFINNKMILFQWIEPRHLEIENLDYTDIINNFKKIEKQFTTTMMIKIVLKTIKLVYKLKSKNIGQDELLPTLILIIIRSKVHNIFIIMDFIKKYRRRKYPKCAPNCLHLNTSGNINILNCSCINFLDNTPEREINFYLTTFESAVVFIEKMEYNTINIKQEEYENNILRFVNNIQKIPKEEKSYIAKTKKKIKKIFGSLTDLRFTGNK